jgi:hypothetical protein
MRLTTWRGSGDDGYRPALIGYAPVGPELMVV